jgi:allantoicase
VIVQLAAEGTLRRIEVDTNHFKGNYPDTCSIEGTRAFAPDAIDAEWFDILPRTKLQAHTRHSFIDELADRGPVTHLRLNVFPDGGVSRLRVHGVATDEGRGAAVVQRINTLTDDAAAAELRSCCASSEWVRRMVASRPFESWNELLRVAEEHWWALDAAQWREAFAAHPRIGEKKAAPSQSATAARWSGEEQSRATAAAAETLTALAEANQRYEERFGVTYIVCATGKSADEMLALAQQRLGNEPAAELRLAAEEQMKITKLRLLKLVG